MTKKIIGEVKNKLTIIRKNLETLAAVYIYIYIYTFVVSNNNAIFASNNHVKKTIYDGIS